MAVIEEYVEEQARNNKYHLEAYLAVLKLYQFNPNRLNMNITYTILLKALTNLPHTDFTLCKCLLLPAQIQDETVQTIIHLARVLESCNFEQFWDLIDHKLVMHISGFNDSIRKFVCHVVGITFQSIEKVYLARLLGNVDDKILAAWVKKYGWKDQGQLIFIANQDDNIKAKNITEKIEFDNLSHLMAGCL